MDVSVVIVNWNTRQLLLECVRSLYAETHASSLEVIVVDNGSTDGSTAALAEAFPSVRLIANRDNLGFSAANNQGLVVADGRYLCLVNSDVAALDGVIDRMRLYLDDHPEIGALAPRTVGGDLQLRRNCRDYPTLRNEASQALFLDRLFPSVRFFRGRTLKDYDYAAPADIQVLSGCFLMVSRVVWETVGGLDERFFIYAEDVDWCRRIHQAGWRVVYYPQAQAIHYGGSSASVERIRFDREQMRSNLQYWRKHHGRAGAVAYWVIQLIGTVLRAVAWSVAAVLPRVDRSRARVRAGTYWRLLGWLARQPVRQRPRSRVARDGSWVTPDREVA